MLYHSEIGFASGFQKCKARWMALENELILDIEKCDKWTLVWTDDDDDPNWLFFAWKL